MKVVSSYTMVHLGKLAVEKMNDSLRKQWSQNDNRKSESDGIGIRAPSHTSVWVWKYLTSSLGS